jgi:homoserine dehydrogenase
MRRGCQGNDRKHRPPNGTVGILNLALIGYGNVGRALLRLLSARRAAYPFRITGIHTATRGTAYDSRGSGANPEFGPAAPSIAAFLDNARAEIAIEVTTLNPETGEPAISHIRETFRRGAHVVTANKGPIAHAYSELRDEARIAGVEFRFESTCMDGAPVFNMVRNNLPGVQILGFTGVLNSTSKIAIAAMRRGQSLEQGLDEARAMGIAEADASYDIDGWDSSAKTAALANVLMDARVTPRDVQRKGIREATPEYVQALARDGKQLCLVSRAERLGADLVLRTQPEILADNDILAAVQGTSNLLLLHTDLMGTVGTVSIDPGVEQTAYGIFSDIIDIARSL